MRLRNVAALLGALALTISATGSVLATQPTGHKITICHGTSSDTNPYTNPTVDIASAGYGVGGHAGHTGDIWSSVPKSDMPDWGDIIPAFDYGDFHYDGMNWTDEGKAIWRDNCVAPDEAVNHPAIYLDKNPSTGFLPAGGGEVTYTYAVTNIGDVPLFDVSLADDKCSPVDVVGGDDNGDELLDLHETWTYTCVMNLTETTENYALATGHNGDETVTAMDEVTVVVAPPALENHPGIDLVKTPSVETLPVGGGDVTYSYAVTNTGDVALSDVTVVDDKCSPVTYATGDANADTFLDLAETWTFTCDATLAETTTNYAVATGHDGQDKVDAMDQATVIVPPPTADGHAPGIHVEKTASASSFPAGGGTVTYAYVVTNSGDVALSDVTVTDDKCSPVVYVGGDANSDDLLDLAESWTYSCTSTITATTTNTATATGHDGEAAVSDTDDATVTVGSDGGVKGDGAVKGETHVPTAPPTDTNGSMTGDGGGPLPLLLIFLGIIGLAALLTPARTRR